ncbi:Zinc finger protein NUTCRACKER [Hibiscus syriacus]|uniref:Zinc finger protein NUTCRACKER n=1 Tax=Hibiscus syriacus TaxID=106335 RepID=A0A6A2YX60_HIBSY|nr:zinc finger protein NUTCRACKER-like [Hibiscus syriacus]KAE8684104.1 Zinc finger protein NUTCRACKER [Hibiscus syriacus]
MSNITGDGQNFHGSTNSLLPTNSNASTAPKEQPHTVPPPTKKKRSLPGTPDPNAEVIALSPKTLLATNRFVCEICNKGFQREQNLQLHRRGHNLPWKLKQRTTAEIRKRVYVCPEPSCVHHNPARALGDLTGIKKHFCRKHGEKKWKCDKCSKKYAVQSDWKAHSKTCGTKEYKCDCGTIFSRRDSFITHRAFCDSLTEENNKASQGLAVPNVGPTNPQGQVVAAAADHLIPAIPINNNPNISDPFSNDTKSSLQPLNMTRTMFSDGHGSVFGGAKPGNIRFDGNSGHLFSGPASMSATALLQKAAQMGATASTSSLNSPTLINQSLVTTSTMAPPSFFSMQSSAVNNDMAMFSGIFEQNNASCAGLSGFSADTMTVDFLGIGGSRPRNLLEKHQHQQQQQQQELDQLGGIGEGRVQGFSHFQQHAAMWKV